MTVQCLTDIQKSQVATDYVNKKYSITLLAARYGVSERTVTRVLDEFDIPTPMPRVRGEAYQALQILKKHGLTVQELDAALTTPQISVEAVQQYLNQCSKAELAKLFYSSALVKILESLKLQKEEQQKEAAHAEAT